MKDLLLENYIKEFVYNLKKEDLHEISLKNFSPKTALETGLQIGTLSLLAFLGVEMNKSSELPTAPKAQAELVVDTAEDLGVLESSDSEETEDALENAFKKQPLEVVYDRIPAREISILRNWLSDKKQGHEVSVDGHILSREDFKVFQDLNDENEMKGLEPISIEKFMEMLENEKKWEKYRLEKQEQREKEEKEQEKIVSLFNATPEGITIDFDKVGLDKNNNRSPSQFIKDSELISKSLKILMNAEETKSIPSHSISVHKLDKTLIMAVALMKRIDEDGYWKASEGRGGVSGLSVEQLSEFYSNFKNPEVKEIVDAYLADGQ